MKPMECSMGTDCEDDKYTFWNWQKPMIDEVESSVRSEGLWFMQDVEDVDMWNKGLGCGHDDILIYDRKGRVSAYLPSSLSFKALEESGQAAKNNITFVEQDLDTDEGYDNVKEAVLYAMTDWNALWCHIPSPDHIAGQNLEDMDWTDAEEGALFVVAMMFVFVFAVIVGKYFIKKEDERAGRWTKLGDEDGDEDDGDDEFGEMEMNFELQKLGIRHIASIDLEGRRGLRGEEVDDDDEDVFKDNWGK